MTYLLIISSLTLFGLVGIFIGVYKNLNVRKEISGKNYSEHVDYLLGMD